MEVYCLIHADGELIKSSHSYQSVCKRKEELEDDAYSEAQENLGYDEDELLSEQEEREVEFVAGYNSGYYYIEEFDEDDLEEEEYVATSKGDRISVADIQYMLDDEEDDENECDW